MWLLRRHTNLSFPSIGNLLGGRDHSTVMSGVKRVQALVEARPHYAAELDGLLRPVRYIPLKGMFAEEGAGL
jgi:chromosomal replication initiator protein